MSEYRKQEKNLEVILSIVMNKYIFIQSVINQIEMKAGALLAAIIAILLFFMMKDLREFNNFFLYTGVIFGVFSIGMSLYVFWIKDYFDPPPINKLFTREMLNSDHIYVINKSVANIVSAYKKVLKVSKEKSKYLNFSFVFFVISILLLFISKFVSFGM